MRPFLSTITFLQLQPSSLLQNDWFAQKVKWFMVWYGLVFVFIILITFSIRYGVQPIPSGLYLTLLLGIAATMLLIFMPLSLFRKTAYLSTPGYLIFIHFFLSFTGGAVSPYHPVIYVMPVIFASMLFDYKGAIITTILVGICHLILDPNWSLNHLLVSDLHFFSIIAITGFMAAFFAAALEKDSDNLANLFILSEKAKKELEASFDAITDMIAIHDKDYRILRANRALALRLNKDPEELVNKRCYELYHGTEEPIPLCPHKKTLETGEPQTAVMEEPHLHGILEISTYPIFDESGAVKCAVHYTKDITAQKEAENTIKRELEITKTLHNTDKAILSTVDRREVLRLCLVNLRTLIDTEYMSIVVIEPEKEELRVVMSLFCGRLIEDEASVSFPMTTLSSVVFQKSSRYCPDIEEEDLFPCVRSFGIKSLLIVPLIAKGRPLGVLNLGGLNGDRFTREEIELAERYAFQVAIAIDNSNLYQGLQELFMNTVTSLSSAIEARSQWTQNHSEKASSYAIAVARELGLDESFIKDLRLAVLLHDIGKIGVEDRIINKPAPLLQEEMEAVKAHAVKGAEILEPIKELKEIVVIIRHHHERWGDGRGYPDGLSGNIIPLGARILNVVDAFESMTSDRPYRQRMTVEEARDELLKHSGTQFDPMVVEAFGRVIEAQGLLKNNLKTA